MPPSIVVPEPLKSSPDIAKLNGMTARTVTVTRHVHRNMPGQMVVPPTKGASVDTINTLMTILPQQFGPGTYRFEVFDEAGTDKDVWTVKLGAESSDGGASVLQLPTGGWAGAAQEPAGAAGVRQLGHGFAWDADTGLLTTPDRRVYQWRPGEPLPAALSGGVAAVAGPASPWTQLPTASADGSREVDQLREELRSERSQRREDGLRAEITQMRTDFGKALDAVVSKLTERPSGPDPETVALRQEITQMRLAAEARTREDAIRLEMRAQNERFEAAMRELTANRADPMLPILTQLMTAQQGASSEAIRAITSATSSQVESSKQQLQLIAQQFGGAAMTPDKMISVLREVSSSMQSGKDEVGKAQVEMFKNLFSMAEGLLEKQAEINQAGAEPAWAGPLRQGLAAAGRVAQTIAQRQGQPQQQPQVVVVPQQPRSVPVPVQARPVAPPQAPVTPIQGIGRPPQAPAQPQQKAPPARGRKKAAPPAAAAAPPPTAAATPSPPTVAAPAPPTQKEAHEAMKGASADDVRAATAALSDEEFFGVALESVVDLRARAAGGLDSAEIAEQVLGARAFFRGSGEYPPAAELLSYGQYEVLLERLLPEAPEGYRREVVDAIREQLDEEGEGDEGEEEAGDDDGDDAA